MKMDELKKHGASVSSVEKFLDDARKAGSRGDVAGAFQMLMEADQKISVVEDAHRKYVDATIAAESASRTLPDMEYQRRSPKGSSRWRTSRRRTTTNPL